MAPLPPPPPPAPPPPPLGGPPASGPPKISKNEALDRNALLSQIRGGAKLKKAKVVNDRSAPIIDGKSSSNTTNSSSGSNKPVSNGPVGPMQLGGLFAGGVPKLKPTGSKLVSNGLTVSANKVNNSCTKTDESVRRTPSINTSSIKTSLEEKFQNNSSFLHSKSSSNSNIGYGLNVANNSNKFHTMKAREKPSYLSEGKGQAPQVPSPNKPNAPELPRKPPGVQRSNSQTSGRVGAAGGRRPGPPSMKPPPPPKTSTTTPSQTSQSSVARTPSFNDESKNNSTDNWSKRPDISALVNNFNQQNIRPPAPPRNGSTMVSGGSQSPAYPPPPPPPVSTIPTRSNSSAVRLPSQVKANAPSIPTQAPKAPPPSRPPIGPPPPPPHRTTSNATSNYPPPPPPSQTKVIPAAYRNGNIAPAPPPPVRNASMSREQPTAEFSSRFAQFKAIFELPAPTPMSATNKVYPSQMQQSQRRRDPPPPPPQSNGMAGHSPNMNAHNGNPKKLNPVLHIQIGSAVTQS